MRRLISIVVCLASLLPVRAAVKLALAPKPGMPSEPVFLLTEAFSKIPDVQLLERAELDRISRERALSATSANDVLQAARLLGADAVMFLESSGSRTNQVIGARLAVVSKGAIIHANRAPWSSAWTATMVREFGQLIPKTILPPDRALKLSVLNLRSPGNAASAEALDREVTTLLLLRLSHEPDVLVLERRKLADLAFEKELEQNSEQFWTGSYLIDGTVNPNGVQPNVVDLSVRLQTPGSPPQQIAVQGVRTQLIDLIDQLAVTLLRKLNTTAKGRWDPAAEAAQHLNEAEWALRWRMHEEAQAAADSAWALGLQTPQSASARALAYAREAIAAPRQWVHNLGPSLFESYATVKPGPQPSMLHPLRIGLAFTESTLAQFQPWFTNQQWNGAVTEVLEAAGQTLDHYYWDPKSRNQAELPEVRQYARSILNMAMEHPENQRWFWFDGEGPESKILDEYYKNPNVFQTATTHAGVFYDTPEEGLSAYRKILSGAAFPYVREFLFGRHPKNPRLPAWRTADQGRIKNLWVGFVDELCASTNVMLQIEGRYFSLELLPDLPALQKEVHAFLGIIKDTNGLSLYRVPPRFHESAHNVADSRTWPNDKIGSGAVTLINDTREFFQSFDGHYSYLKTQNAHAILQRRFKDHIASVKPYDPALFSGYLRGIITRDEARAATNELTTYLSAVTNTPKGLDAKATAEINEQLAMLEKVIARPTPEERRKQFETMRQATMDRARTNRTNQASQAAQAVSKPAPGTNSFVIRLTADDFWQFPTRNFLVDIVDGRAPIYRDGKLWFLADESFMRLNKAANSMSSSTRPILLNVDPSTLTTNIFTAASKADEYSAGDIFGAIRARNRQFSFEAIDPYFFLIEDQQLRRLDTRTRKWAELPLPVSDGVLYRVQDRLILSAESGIFELLENGAKSRVLASVRRRPAVTILDSFETFGKPPAIVPGPNGAVRALLNGNAYRFKADDWNTETQFTNLATTIRGENILFEGGPFAELHLLAPTNTAPLFIGTGPIRNARGVSASLKRSQALFDLPERFSGDRVFMVLDGYAAIWEFSTITVFDPAQPRALSIPIEFEMRLPKVQGIGGNFLLTKLWMAQSESGFLLGLPGYNGFWKISRADLNRAFAQARRRATQ